MRIENVSADQRVSTRIEADTIAVVGLGYVGLPLAVRLGEVFSRVVGFDLSGQRVARLNDGVDDTGEIGHERLAASNLVFSVDPAILASASIYIVAVPTPIRPDKRPDLTPLESACRTIAPHLGKGDLVIFESTVYPGVTEDICGPILEAGSDLRAGYDFNLGYSPERINPGDQVNRLETIVKVVSADTPAALDRVASLYGRVIDAGVFRCSSIRVAEAAKVMENTQRDVNIALMNELSVICQRIGISANEVIDAAATKWNFAPFRPGLVGGHCIGVDPYYIAALAEELGHHPEVILAGRRLNDSMVNQVATALIRRLVLRGGAVRAARVGLFGLSFKADVPDLRNSKAIELVTALGGFGLSVMVSDAVCAPDAVEASGLSLTDPNEMHDLDLLVVAADHKAYLEDPAFPGRVKPDGIFADIRGAFRGRTLPAGVDYWSL
ncbi:nucleotide sugar dehydrogenase [Rhodovulum tesquicola]|uniref:UDP-N-acetyl-D-galactosamine dehydrogenase n=1 Tax=Rhodovulum steppense TaxID=540251 RepID=A0A4R1YWI4_9RHOB|nr:MULTISPECIES: nucleotide sugar dehydrogenase [Rhodovulum]MCO8146827.1 nucleotide sugar dehydrogenase [Rhodovulum tesquicola]TCM85518.1 UDP-N-acetyl-D-galactosamine dehydrogenase [Rhodovulum steppense]